MRRGSPGEPDDSMQGRWMPDGDKAGVDKDEADQDEADKGEADNGEADKVKQIKVKLMKRIQRIMEEKIDEQAA